MNEKQEICYRAMDALSVIFVMLLLITINSMTMITLRVAVRGIEFDDEYDGDDDEDDDDELVGDEAYVVTGMEDPDERRVETKATERKNRELEESFETEDSRPKDIRPNIKQNGYDEISDLTLFTDADPILSADDTEIEVSLNLLPPELNPSYDDDAEKEIYLLESDSDSHEMENSRIRKNKRTDATI